MGRTTLHCGEMNILLRGPNILSWLGCVHNGKEQRICVTVQHQTSVLSSQATKWNWGSPYCYLWHQTIFEHNFVGHSIRSCAVRVSHNKLHMEVFFKGIILILSSYVLQKYLVSILIGFIVDAGRNWLFPLVCGWWLDICSLVSMYVGVICVLLSNGKSLCRILSKYWILK